MYNPAQVHPKKYWNERNPNGVKQVGVVQHSTRFLPLKIFRFAYTLPARFKAEYLVHLTTADTPLAFFTTSLTSHMPAWSICHVLSNVSTLREQPWFHGASRNGAPTWISTELQTEFLRVEEQMEALWSGGLSARRDGYINADPWWAWRHVNLHWTDNGRMEISG